MNRVTREGNCISVTYDPPQLVTITETWIHSDAYPLIVTATCSECSALAELCRVRQIPGLEPEMTLFCRQHAEPRSGPLFIGTVDLSLWGKACTLGPCAQGIDYRGYMPSIIMGSAGYVKTHRDAIRRHMQYVELHHLNRAKLLFESEPGPHDWLNSIPRLWFCELNGLQFAVVADNPDSALSAVDEAYGIKV